MICTVVRWVALAAVLGTAPTAAAERVLTIDPGASQVSFTVDSTLHLVHGRMKLTEGQIRFDAEHGEASGRLVVDAASLATGNGSRDNKVKGDVLESQLFPTVELAVKAVRGTFLDEGKSRLELGGVLTLHGQPHEMKLTADVTAHDRRATATTRFAVPYLDWGLADPSILFLRAARIVEAEVSIVGTLAGGPGPAVPQPPATRAPGTRR